MAGFFAKLVGGAAMPALGVVDNIVGGVFKNKEQKLTHKEVMAALAQRPQEMQVELNKLEAQHRSVFVAGWRPAIGWVCALGLGNTFILNPWIQWITGSPGPDLQTQTLMTLVTALLGLGALRTVEKLNDRAK